jgi:hypothetical protein
MPPVDLQLFHIFRNTSLGRETLLQSAYFCKKLGLLPIIYIPKHLKFLMYFENQAVQVDLDSSFLNAPSTARQHAIDIIRSLDLPEPKFLEPQNFTASTLPDIPVNFDYMACPRIISDLSSKIGLGSICPQVRGIIHSARFPVLIPCSAYKQWQSIVVFFGGSVNAAKALRLGLKLARATGFPLDVFTQSEGHDKAYYESVLENKGLRTEMDTHVREWLFFESDDFINNLYEVPHDALAIMGAYGHGLIKDVLFGNTLEKIQSELPNNLLIVGPNFRSEL